MLTQIDIPSCLSGRATEPGNARWAMACQPAAWRGPYHTVVAPPSGRHSTSPLLDENAARVELCCLVLLWQSIEQILLSCHDYVESGGNPLMPGIELSQDRVEIREKRWR